MWVCLTPLSTHSLSFCFTSSYLAKKYVNFLQAFRVIPFARPKRISYSLHTRSSTHTLTLTFPFGVKKKEKLKQSKVATCVDCRARITLEMGVIQLNYSPYPAPVCLPRLFPTNAHTHQRVNGFAGVCSKVFFCCCCA